MMEMKMTGNGPADLKAISKRIRSTATPKQIRKDLTAGLKAGAQPAAVKVKAAALALPAKPGGKSTGLRKKMARVTNVQVRTGGNQAGVKVRISRARMGSQASLPKVTNEGLWRHPVYGNREHWVRQLSRRGWFDGAAASAAGSVGRELKRVVDTIQKRIENY
jgi:hypothetical protein